VSIIGVLCARVSRAGGVHQGGPQGLNLGFAESRLGGPGLFRAYGEATVNFISGGGARRRAIERVMHWPTEKNGMDNPSEEKV
jgi:hypothetical protein